MKYLQAMAVLIFLLGLLVNNTCARDNAGSAFGNTGMPFGDVSGFDESALSDVDMGASTFGAAAGVPTAVAGASDTLAGVPTGISGLSDITASASTFGAAASVPASDISVSSAAAGVPTSSLMEAAFYSTAAPPSSQQNVLLDFDVVASPPTSVYYGGKYIPYYEFSVGLSRTTPSFWVLTRGGWSVYATCPLGGWARYLMYVPYTGNLKMYELYPDTTVRFYNYGWTTRGFKYLWFIGDMPGRHISFITLTDRPSNFVTIDVV